MRRATATTADIMLPVSIEINKQVLLMLQNLSLRLFVLEQRQKSELVTYLLSGCVSLYNLRLKLRFVLIQFSFTYVTYMLHITCTAYDSPFRKALTLVGQVSQSFSLAYKESPVGCSWSHTFAALVFCNLWSLLACCSVYMLGGTLIWFSNLVVSEGSSPACKKSPVCNSGRSLLRTS